MPMASPDKVLSPQRLPPSPTSVMEVNSKSLMVSWTPEDPDKGAPPSPPRETRPTSLVQQIQLSARELQRQSSSFSSIYWHVLVGVAAFLDFCATVLAPYFPEDDGFQPVTTPGLFFNRTRQEYVVTDDPLFDDILQWLNIWFVPIGFFFSILWFVDAFVKACWKRDEKIDRQRLLEGKIIKGTNATWRAFYCTMVFQLLVLPVGFYVAVWKALLLPWGANTDQDEKCHVGKNDDIDIRSTHSLLFALLNYSFVVMNRLVGVGVRTRRKALSRQIAKRLTKFAVRHPRLFRYRLELSLRTIRWIKYLAPLVGGLNKLRGNTIDLLKRYRQRIMAEKASRQRKRRWHELSGIEKRMAAAIMIQKSFRGMEVRKSVRALNILEGSKKTMIAIKMQKAFRASLARARSRIAEKKQELKRLQAQAEATKTSSMSDNDRRRMYQLQDELGRQAKELVNRKLILRPNTTFAVTWRFLFVLCVLYEIALKCLSHRLKEYKDEETGESLDVTSILVREFVPSPVSEWEECSPWLATKDEEQSPFQYLFSLGGKQTNPDRIEESCPWYCQEPVVTMQSIFILAIHFVLTKTLLIISWIMFLDVFVSFFTGELHAKNGSLKPKAFFKRWLVPGLVLQLLVNPQMKTTSEWVIKLLNGIIYVGPVRAWRWIAALWFPVLKLIVRAAEMNIWRPLVQQQNQDVLQRKLKESAVVQAEEPGDFRRRSAIRLSIREQVSIVK